ncbi:MAG: hypothetical protein ACYC6M_10525 [Terriglobales bacterium]
MKTCQEIVSLVTTESPTGETMWTRVSIGLHLRLCTHCSRLVRQLKQIARISRATREEPSPDLEERILYRLLKKDRLE